MRFMAKKMTLCVDLIEKYLSRMEWTILCHYCSTVSLVGHLIEPNDLSFLLTTSLHFIHPIVCYHVDYSMNITWHVICISIFTSWLSSYFMHLFPAKFHSYSYWNAIYMWAYLLLYMFVVVDVYAFLLTCFSFFFVDFFKWGWYGDDEYKNCHNAQRQVRLIKSRSKWGALRGRMKSCWYLSFAAIRCPMWLEEAEITMEWIFPFLFLMFLHYAISTAFHTLLSCCWWLLSLCLLLECFKFSTS